MSNFTPKLVENDQEKPEPRTINDLYDEIFYEVSSMPNLSEHAETARDFIQELSAIALALYSELNQFRASMPPPLTGRMHQMMMALGDADDRAINDLFYAWGEVDRASNVVSNNLSNIREHHAELSSTASNSIHSYKQGFDKAKEKYGPLVVPRELLSMEQRHEVWSKTDGKCVYCSADLAEPDVGQFEPGNGEKLHVDHLVAKSCGGPDHMANYVPSCEPCNMRKSAKDPVKFVWALKNFKALADAAERDDGIPF